MAPSLVNRALALVGLRTLDNPTTFANPANWLTNALGASPSTSGVSVNEQTAMRYPAAFACINVLSKDQAQLPAKVFKHTGLDREEARDHDVWRVMHDRPNEWMTPFTFKQTMAAHMVSWGNGYAEIERTNGGKVLNLWPLLPDRTKPVIRNGVKWFSTKVTEPNGQKREVFLPADRVLHIPGLGFDGLQGYSVIGLARNAIGMGMAAEEFGARFFSNGATPRYGLMHPKNLSKDAKERLRLDFDANVAGLTNAHRTMVFEEGMTVEKLGLPASDAQLIEVSNFSIEEMCRFFDVPKMRLHSSEGVTSWGTGLEQWQRAYLTHTLGPWLTLWEESLNWSLFSDAERKVYYVEFVREALMQADTQARGEWYAKLITSGVMSPNQVARKENLPAFDGGDEHFMQGAMVPISKIEAMVDAQIKAGNQPKPDPTQKKEPRALPAPKLRDACYRLYRQAAERTVTKYVQRSRAKLKKLAEDGNLDGFRTWLREFADDERTSIQIAFAPATMALADLSGVDAGLVQAHAEGISRNITTALVTELLALSDADAITATLTAWESSRADAIATQETDTAVSLMSRLSLENAA